ncbi:hypothetical protein PHET_05307 [Paragonimus heterotremus]|uniref:Uncharacterized protein n=1 Tax=Paragonimus heterotremus TaxID=100268 RepID=A0A8J4T0W6_9TREM|nr:hypothetical protein PHET_05307 [Paragonimus heterotremus]
MSRQKSHSPTPLKILTPPGNHQSVSMETSEEVTENGNLLNGTTDHKRDVSWQNLLTSDGRVTYKEGNYFNHATHTEEIIVREANCGSRPESPQKSFVDDIDPSLHPRLRTFSPTPGAGDSFNGNQRTHRNLDNTDSHYTNHNKIGLPDQTSSSKFQKAPDEDIVDLIMPSQECSQPKLILFEAPAALKKTVTMRRFGGASPDSVNNGKQRSTAPVVTDQRHGVVTRTGQSTFRRADTLPLKHPVNYSSSSAKREATARVSVKGQQLQLPSGVERNSRGDFTTLNINENRSVSPVQIIRTARHDENKLIEIVRKPGTEFQSRSPNQRSMRSPKPTYAHPVDVYASVRRPKQLSPGTELKPNSFTQPEHVIQVNGARTDTEGIQSVRTSNYQQSPIRIQTPIDQFPVHNTERESMRPYFRSFNSSNIKPLRYAQSTPSSPVLGQSYYHRDHSMSPLGTRFSDTIDSVDGGVFKNDSRPSGLPPTPHRIGVGRNGRKDTPLTPTGPPVEHVSMCIDPVTGKPLRVTARSQSFTDLDHNVLVTETDEKIESEDQTEYRVKHQTIRKHRAGSPRDRRSSSQIERGPETIQQQQQFHNQTRDTDETVTEWRRHFKPLANAAPHRATSQVNIAGRTNLGRPQWQSDMNLRTSTSYKQTPMLSTYSAHRENLQRREEQRRNFEDGTSRQFSTRYFDESKTVGGGAEVMEEVETITLQPIGRGVHDLEPVGSIARSVRTNTPTGSYPLVPLQTRPHSSAGRLYHCAPKVGNPLRTGYTLTRSSSQSPLPLRPPNAVSSTIRSSFRETPVGVSAQHHTNARFASANGSPTFFRYDSNAMKSFTPRGSLPSPSNQMSVVGENKTGAVQVVTSSAQHLRSYQNPHQSPQQRPPTPLDRGITQQQDYSNSVVRRPSSPSLPAAPSVSTVPTRKQSLQSPSPIGFVSRAFTPAGFDQSDGYRTIATTNLHREVHTSGAPSPYPGTHHSPYYDSNTRSSEQRYRTMQHTGQQIRATTGEYYPALPNI